MKSIILLSGPPGAGKTTVAAELVAISPAPVAYIEGDKFWPFIAKPTSKKDGDFKNFKMIMRAITTASLPFALAGYEVILDFSVPPWYLEVIKKITEKKEIPLHYVVIRPDEKICAARAAMRSQGTIADYTGAMKDLYTSFDAAQKYIIYDNESSPGRIAAKIREGINEGMFYVSG